MFDVLQSKIKNKSKIKTLDNPAPCPFVPIRVHSWFQLTTPSPFVVPTNKQSGTIAASTIYRASVVNTFPDEEISEPQMTQISADDCLQCRDLRPSAQSVV